MYFELNENEDTTLSKFVGLPKAALSRKFIALNAYIRKGNKFQTNHLSFYVKKLDV